MKCQYHQLPISTCVPSLMAGEPLGNLPGVVHHLHDHGSLPHAEIPSMALISLASITAGGSLGPEAPLVSMGGGLASWLGARLGLSKPSQLVPS